MRAQRDGCDCRTTGAETCRGCPHSATEHARYRRGTKHVAAGACTSPDCGCSGYERTTACANERRRRGVTDDNEIRKRLTFRLLLWDLVNADSIAEMALPVVRELIDEASAEPHDAQAIAFYTAGDPPPKVGTPVVGVPSIYPWRVTHVAEDGTVTISPGETEAVMEPMTGEPDLDRGRQIARHYPLHRVLQESLAHEVAYAMAWSRGEILTALRELHNVACENEKDYPAYANATWDAIERVQRAAGIEELWPE